MNLKQIGLLLLIACFGQSVMATELYKGRIIKDKLWSDDGRPVKLTKAQHIMHTDKTARYIDVSLNRVITTVDEEATINPISRVSVINGTAKERQYVLLQVVCAEIADKTNHCVYHSIDLALEPGGSFYTDSIPELNVLYTVRGTYKTFARVGVMNASRMGGLFGTSSGVIIVN